MLSYRVHFYWSFWVIKWGKTSKGNKNLNTYLRRKCCILQCTQRFDGECNEKSVCMFIQRISIITSISITTTWTQFDHFSLTWFPLPSHSSIINHRMHRNLTLNWRIRSYFLFLFIKFVQFENFLRHLRADELWIEIAHARVSQHVLPFYCRSAPLWSCSFQDNAITILLSSPKIISLMVLSSLFQTEQLNGVDHFHERADFQPFSSYCHKCHDGRSQLLAHRKYNFLIIVRNCETIF